MMAKHREVTRIGCVCARRCLCVTITVLWGWCCYLPTQTAHGGSAETSHLTIGPGLSHSDPEGRFRSGELIKCSGFGRVTQEQEAPAPNLSENWTPAPGPSGGTLTIPTFCLCHWLAAGVCAQAEPWSNRSVLWVGSARAAHWKASSGNPAVQKLHYTHLAWVPPPRLWRHRGPAHSPGKGRSCIEGDPQRLSSSCMKTTTESSLT